MTVIASKGRKIVAGLLTSAVLAGAFAPSAAFAGNGHRWGYAAAGLGGGLLIGALAAQPRYVEREVVYDRRCWTERRRVYDAYGDAYVRRVRVCD